MTKDKIINRRMFLKKTAHLTAGTLAFPYVIPSSALGKAGTVAPSETGLILVFF